MDSNLFRLSLRSPFLPAILEVSDQLLLLGVHGDDGVLRPQILLGLAADVLKLPISIRVRRPFDCLAVRLEAVVQIMEQFPPCDGWSYAPSDSARGRARARSCT